MASTKTDEVAVEIEVSQMSIPATVERAQLEGDIDSLRDAVAKATGAAHEILKRRLEKLEKEHVYTHIPEVNLPSPAESIEQQKVSDPTFNLLDSPRLTTHLSQAGFPDESIKDNWIDESGFVWEIGIADDGIAYTWCVNWSPVRT